VNGLSRHTAARQRVLILCTGNSARSQMGEGLLRALGGDRYEVHSAGSQPSGYVHPGAVQAMREIGLDISAHTSKSLREFTGQPFDFVLTVCDNAAEACPVFPGKATRLHRDFSDPVKAPADEQPAVFRRVRDDIAAWLREILPLD
jgi:arsenate reductase